MKNPVHKTYSIKDSDKEQRLDQFLSVKTNISRNQIQTLIKKGEILCNSKKTKASYLIQTDDEIFIALTPNENEKDYKITQNSNINVEIVYEDNDVLVVNKPAGLVTHPGAGHEKNSLVHSFFDRLPKNHHAPLRPGVVHRLDKDTQGLLVLAKNLDAQENLSKQFKEKTAKRTYRTLCFGKFKKNTGTFKSFLKRDPKDRKKYKSQEEGRLAITHFKVVKENEISYVELALETGRTHQIRVHLSENHHPILNDSIYGHHKRIKEIKDKNLKNFIKNLNHMPLVAIGLAFNHPGSNKKMEFSIPWPKEFIYENLSD